jgi:adenine phosphoribosyltransferase
LAYALGTPLILARRAGTLPRATLRQSYLALGIGPTTEREMVIHVGAIEPGTRVLIVDDVLASGGTALAALDVIEQAGGRSCGVSVAVELARFDARSRLEARGTPVLAAVRL